MAACVYGELRDPVAMALLLLCQTGNRKQCQSLA
jgi:hypothetical protein